jgi:ribonuclease PH
MRPSGRRPDQLREIVLEPHPSKHAEGSCLARFGDTHVLCTASLDNSVPGFMRGSGKGWVTAEYGMLPRATHTRGAREAARGKQGGRTLEIQRLIGRSLRAVTDMSGFGERSIQLDCDVIQADGGTRTAAITGAYVALYLAFDFMRQAKAIDAIPLSDQVAAVSCGLYKGTPVLDLDYDEDSAAEADANFVLTGRGGIVEVQAAAETDPYDRQRFLELMDLAEGGVRQLCRKQLEAIGVPG